MKQANNSLCLSLRILWETPLWGSKRCSPRTTLLVGFAGRAGKPELSYGIS